MFKEYLFLLKLPILEYFLNITLSSTKVRNFPSKSNFNSVKHHCPGYLQSEHWSELRLISLPLNGLIRCDHCSAKSRSLFFSFFKLENIPVIFKDMETWGAVHHLKKIFSD